MTQDENPAASRERAIYKVTLTGTLCNVFLLLFKAVAGIVGQSAAMVADAVHSLSDFITDVIVLFFVRLSAKPQDEDHEYGHGKYETLATSLIGLSLFGVGLYLFYGAACRILLFVQGGVLPTPRGIALMAAAVSIVVKEALYWYTVRCGRALQSQAVVANAWHHRSDALSSIATLVGIGGAILLGARWTVLDPVAAVLVSVLIMRVAVDLLKQSTGDLLDHALPRDVEKRILEAITDFPEVENPHHLRTRRIGSRHSVDVHVRMDGNLTVHVSHSVTCRIEARLREMLGAETIINIHVEPRK